MTEETDIFTDDWRITTKEEIEVLRKAFEDAEKREPEERVDVHAILEEGIRYLRERRSNAP